MPAASVREATNAFAWGRRRRSEGPDHPAFTERAIAAITLTGVVAVLGRAVVDWFLAPP